MAADSTPGNPDKAAGFEKQHAEEQENVHGNPRLTSQDRIETRSVHELQDDDSGRPEGEAQGEGQQNGNNEDDNNDDNSQNNDDASSTSSNSSGPAGGYDATPIPHREPGYTIKITIHCAQNLPMADIHSLSSDPYVLTQMYTNNPTRHKEDPPLKMRTFTVRKDVNPVWNVDWVVANVPKSFYLKARVYDEDPSDHDDRLGNAHIEVSNINENWQGFKEKSFKIKKRMGSKRAYLVQAIATGVRQRKQMDGYLVVSIEMLGKTQSEHGARTYTVGPMWWTKHYSPLLGRMVGRKTPGKPNEEEQSEEDKKAQRYNFQANQFQLHGPVPAELYHRYVEFRPFVKLMFTSSGIRGYFMQKALFHQHEQIYHFDRTTEFTYLGMQPTYSTTLKFLEAVHWDEGGRIFTYIISLDSLFRFTETGKEFGIDMLSKHTMHSEVAAYIAYSGEFFIRRLKKRHEPPPEKGGNNESHPPNDLGGGPPDDKPPKDPRYYELIIDNDSGTYRPNADLLPKLKAFLNFNLPGIKVVTLDCQKDEKLQQRLKKEQRQKKKEEGQQVIYRQASRGSSISSSDEEDLDAMVEQGRQDAGFKHTVKNDFVKRSAMKKQKLKSLATGKSSHTTAAASMGTDIKTADNDDAKPQTNGSTEKQGESSKQPAANSEPEEKDLYPKHVMSPEAFKVA